MAFRKKTSSRKSRRRGSRRIKKTYGGNILDWFKGKTEDTSKLPSCPTSGSAAMPVATPTSDPSSAAQSYPAEYTPSPTPTKSIYDDAADRSDIRSGRDYGDRSEYPREASDTQGRSYPDDRDRSSSYTPSITGGRRHKKRKTKRSSRKRRGHKSSKRRHSYR